jgi:hypothetical protein
MPKATYNTLSGATVIVEGSENEVAAVLRLLESDTGNLAPVTSHHLAAPKQERGKQGRSTPMGLLADLIASGFFGQPRELGAVRSALEQAGHFYPTTTLSPIMLRLVRRRELRRLKEKNRWVYVG